MKGYLRIFILAPTVFLILTSLIYSNKGPKPIKIGKLAPLKEHKMMGVDGKMNSLEDLKKDNGLLVVFSCNTCPFVIGSENFAGWEVQYNELNKLAEELKIGMVLINSNEAKREGDDSYENMKMRSEKISYTMPYLMDIDSKLADAFGAKTTPHIYLFDKELKLSYTGSIDNSWDSKRTEDLAYLKNSLNSLSKGEKIKENSTPPRGCSIKRKPIN